MGESLGLSAAIRAMSSPAVFMERIIEEALALIGAAEGATVELVDGDELVYVCAAGNLTDFSGLRLAAGDSMSGLAVATDATLRCDDAAHDPRVDREACRKVNAVSMVCVPLRSADRAVGVLKVTATTPYAFSDRDVATLAGLSAFITATINSAAELDAAAEQLLSDPDLVDGSNDRRDTPGMSAFIANVLRPGVVSRIEAAEAVEQVLADRAFHMAYQPIVELARGETAIVEALARFDVEPPRSPDIWFEAAWQAGLGAELELAAVEAALQDLDRLPDGCALAVNVSPLVITRPRLRHLLGVGDPRRVVLELTEHVAIADYPRVRRTLSELRSGGARLAIDDTGAGFASLSHIIKLAPDLIKLDFDLVHGIAEDPVRRSMATAIVAFAADTGAEIIAEGIETEAELEVVHQLGIRYGQGYLLGRPGHLDGIDPTVPVGHPRRVELDGLVARMGRRARAGRVARLGRTTRTRRDRSPAAR